MKIKPTRSYNDLFFKENSRMQYDARNSTFWQLLDDLQTKHPEVDIHVECFLSKRLPVSYYFEDVRITCDQTPILEHSISLYRDHYYIVPLELYTDSKEINDELKGYLVYDEALI